MNAAVAPIEEPPEPAIDHPYHLLQPREQKPRRAKLTRKVRRGLRLVRELAENSLDPDKAPGYTHVRLRWKRGDQSDYDAAIAWLKQEEKTTAAEDAAEGS